MISVLKAGETIPPNNLHAVSVSMPTVADVIGYEEKDPATMKFICSGYPRFLIHPFVLKTARFFQKEMGLSEIPVLFSSEKALVMTGRKIDISQFRLHEEDGITAMDLPIPETKARVVSLLQQTGYLVSSRRAEDFLKKKGMIGEIQKEETLDIDSPLEIRKYLHNIYNNSIDDIYLTVSGMNAVFSAFETLNTARCRENRKIWIRLGWLYLDNIRILESFSHESIVVEDLHDLDRLEKILTDRGPQIAGIIAEAPTNPLMQVPDMKRLKSLGSRFDIPILMDISVGGSMVLDVTKYADVIVESLTKFACGNADVMMGMVVCLPESKYYRAVKDRINDFLEAPYIRDCDRLASEIQTYRERTEMIGKNTALLCEFFEKHPQIRKVHWCNSPETKTHFDLIKRTPDSVAGVVTVEIKTPVEKFYDSLDLYKGPSFGTKFTLNMLYMYLAHYDLVKSQEGKNKLRSLSIDPDLVRISVGVENISSLKEAYNRALE